MQTQKVPISGTSQIFFNFEKGKKNEVRVQTLYKNYF